MQDLSVSSEKPNPDAAVQSVAEERSVVLRIGTRFTTAAHSLGGRVIASRVVSHGPVLLAISQATAANASGAATARVIRSAARQMAERRRLQGFSEAGCRVVGGTGLARAVVILGAAGESRATLAQIRQATEKLGGAWADEKGADASRSWIRPMMVAAAMLESLLECLGATEIEAESEVPQAES